MPIIGRRTKSGLFANLAVILIGLSAGLPGAYAQRGKVILPLREMTVKQALDELQRQTDYKVAVNWEDLDPGRKVFFPSHEPQASELLHTALAGTDFTWELDGGQIVILWRAPDEGRGARSAMTIRDRFRRESMTFIPDPLSRTQRPFEDMFNLRRSYWNPNGGEDSIGMAVVNYRVGSSTLEKEYMDNAETLELLRRSLTDKAVLAGLDYVIVTSGASPEGNTAANERLAAARALAMKSYLTGQYPYLNRDIIYTFSIGEDWSGLREMVQEDPYTPCRGELLAVLDSPLGSEAKRAALRSLDGGEAYRYIASRMLPKLRGAAAVTLHFKEREVREIVVETLRVDTVYIEKTTPERYAVSWTLESQPKKSALPWALEPHPLFALKTNLLFDAASALNLELEIPLGKRWSVAGEWLFPWWLYEKKQYALQVGNATLEVKRWLGNRNGRGRLTGWFAGLYAGGGYYDLEQRTKGWQGEFWHAGLSGGYAHSLGRGGNWRMEYTLGLGYMDTRYREYVPVMGEDGRWHLMRRSNGRRTWGGPTRAKVSLVWMIPHGYRKREGGVR